MRLPCLMLLFSRTVVSTGQTESEMDERDDMSLVILLSVTAL